MDKQQIESTQAPVTIGPYSQAIKSGKLIFLSGQIALDPETNEMVGETAAEQAQQIMKNLKAVLQELECTMDNVVKTTIYLKDINDFSEVNDIYGYFMTEPFPARATIAVADLPKDALVEIEAIAVI